MAHRIDTVKVRSALAPRKTAYWQKLANGRHLGFRKLTAASIGTWFAQAYDPGTREQTRRGLGDFGDVPEHQRFDAAKRAADAWFKHLDCGGTPEVVTVKAACDDYVKQVRKLKGDTRANDIQARFERWVYGDKIAWIELNKLTRKHVEAWRERLEQTPVIVNPYAAEPDLRPRSPSSINRDMTPLRAALNRALDLNDVTSDAAWRIALRPVKGADQRRDIYLDRKQRLKLIEHAASDVAMFLHGMSVLPLRPGALAALSVGQFDERLAVLTVGKDKTGQDRKIPLPKATVAFLRKLAKGREPDAPLFSRADGKRWDKDAWKKPIKEAVIAAGMPDKTTAYTLRHSAITDLVPHLDLLTVAQISGTSVAMIERHYGHLRREQAAAALAKLVL
ncbi:MAG: integrase [Burkholderiales bacterium]|jgi:site-specific recombinase XerD|nr:MAG: integrase [Burkholderiales bacterium]